MSIERFRELFQHIEPQLQLVPKSVARLFATLPCPNKFEASPFHRPTVCKGLLKHLGLDDGNIGASSLVLANNNSSPGSEPIHSHLLVIKSPPPGQPRKRPDMRQQPKAQPADKLPTTQEPKNMKERLNRMHWENHMRSIERREKGVGRKIMFPRLVLKLLLTLSRDKSFKSRPFSLRNTKGLVPMQDSLSQRKEDMALWELHMRRIEEVERRTGKEFGFNRRSLLRAAKHNNWMPTKLRPFAKTVRLHDNGDFTTLRGIRKRYANAWEFKLGKFLIIVQGGLIVGAIAGMFML